MILMRGVGEQLRGAVVGGAQVLRRHVLGQLFEDGKCGQPRTFLVARVLRHFDGAL